MQFHSFMFKSQVDSTTRGNSHMEPAFVKNLRQKMIREKEHSTSPYQEYMGTKYKGIGRQSDDKFFSQRSLLPLERSTNASRNQSTLQLADSKKNLQKSMETQIGAFRARKMRKTHNTVSMPPDLTKTGLREDSYKTLQNQRFPEPRHL